MGDHASTEGTAAQRGQARDIEVHGKVLRPAPESHDIKGIIAAAECTSVTLPTGYFKIPKPIRSLLHVR